MGDYVLEFQEITAGQRAAVGGKAMQLAELARIPGISVPAGFCVSTAGYRRILAQTPALADALERLARLQPDDRHQIVALSAEIREAIAAAQMPAGLIAAITDAVVRLDEHAGYAVRSSATAEDMASASFAGQQDTYLNVVGPTSVLRHVSRCWASLFTERAVTYRLQNGFDHRELAMAVVVQRMVHADAAGVLFTADPISGNRRVASVEAGFGLGEGLVSGRTTADMYRVRDGALESKQVVTKSGAIGAAEAGGTEQREIAAERRRQPALGDIQVVQLVELGRRIEAHFGKPQDIEWCLADGEFSFVQSRPITTLFPIPVANDDRDHVYLSVGHQQMMLDAMRPLGLSIWQLTALRPMHQAGGRLFVDITAELASASKRAQMVQGWTRSDPLTGDALRTIAEREFIPTVPDPEPGAPSTFGPRPARIEPDAAIVSQLIAENQASVAALRHKIRNLTGTAVLDFIREDIVELKSMLFDPRSTQVFMTAIDASAWLNEHVEEWLGEKNVADVLTKSVPNNVTSEMGLALFEIADVLRPHRELVAFLEGVGDADFMDGLLAMTGGREARDAIQAFLEKYGMRCVAEIDITRPRWSERPSTLLPIILGEVKNFDDGEGARRFEQGRQEAGAKESELLERLRALPDGEHKAEEAKRMIDRVRTFIGYREYPKYGIVSRYFVYKQALLAQADRLVDAQVLGDREEIFYLSFDELRDVVSTGAVDRQLIEDRKQAFHAYQTLTPPRVLTSDGEVLAGSYGRDDVPAGALVGLAVSAGTAEGRARVVADIEDADLEPGDILVTTFTDPSWTPLFPTVSGLVTEVGGLMTHGAVIAREYGLPAVVGVEGATRLIADGQRIRVHGTEGYVEILHDWAGTGSVATD